MSRSGSGFTYPVSFSSSTVFSSGFNPAITPAIFPASICSSFDSFEYLRMACGLGLRIKTDFSASLTTASNSFASWFGSVFSTAKLMFDDMSKATSSSLKTFSLVCFADTYIIFCRKVSPTLCLFTLISYTYSRSPFSIVTPSSNQVCPLRIIQSSPPRMTAAASSKVCPFISRCKNRNASSTFDLPLAFVPIKNVNGSIYTVESSKDFQFTKCNLVIMFNQDSFAIAKLTHFSEFTAVSPHFFTDSHFFPLFYRTHAPLFVQ